MFFEGKTSEAGLSEKKERPARVKKEPAVQKKLPEVPAGCRLIRYLHSGRMAVKMADNAEEQVSRGFAEYVPTEGSV